MLSYLLRDYVITKDTQLSELYNLAGTGMTPGEMWVRENTVYVDVLSTTGGGCRAKGTVGASGTVINVEILDRGFGYSAGDTVRILDVSGPGEGAYATPVIDRTLGPVSVDNGGTGYSAETKIIVVDSTGYQAEDGNKAFGKGAEAIPTIENGVITSVEVTKTGSNYIDIAFNIFDPLGGTGAVLSTGINSSIASLSFSERGTGYSNPTPVIIDGGGLWGNAETIGNSFQGTCSLNNGIGSVSIIDDWFDYVDGNARLTVIDIHPEPTGYGATGEVTLNSAGSVSSVTITNSGSAYKQPQLTIDGPVNYIGSAINNVNTDLALFGPKGNAVSSPYSDGVSVNTNYKNGIMVQWQQENGHSLNDSWEFKLQSWIEGTPGNLVYKTYQYDGSSVNTSGIIALKDVWDV